MTHLPCLAAIAGEAGDRLGAAGVESAALDATLPGDLLLFNAHVVHGSSSNHSTDRPRRAFSSRWCDDATVYEARHATMPLLWDHGLSDGDTLRGSLFPQVLPGPIAAEGARRGQGPEPPDPDFVAQVLNRVAERMNRSETTWPGS